MRTSLNNIVWKLARPEEYTGGHNLEANGALQSNIFLFKTSEIKCLSNPMPFVFEGH